MAFVRGHHPNFHCAVCCVDGTGTLVACLLVASFVHAHTQLGQFLADLRTQDGIVFADATTEGQ